jgi:hypothetical protein
MINTKNVYFNENHWWLNLLRGHPKHPNFVKSHILFTLCAQMKTNEYYYTGNIGNIFRFLVLRC